jgi:hypothetical protein
MIYFYKDLRTMKQIREVYMISQATLKKLLEPIKDEAELKNYRTFTPKQVLMILEELNKYSMKEKHFMLKLRKYNK